jgi:hypothetical protein
MTDIAASSTKWVPGWKLLVEFAAAGLPDSNPHLVEQVMDAIRRINLQPVQLERINETLGHAVARTVRSGKPAALHQLRIRIWVLGECTSGRGWGFFLLEKGDDPPSAGANTDHVVELFLYQERDS